MRATYKGRTAGGYLRTARVEEMRAGNVEVVVTVDNYDAHAILGRTDNGTPVVTFADATGPIVRLSLSARAEEKLERLTQQADHKMLHTADPNRYA